MSLNDTTSQPFMLAASEPIVETSSLPDGAETGASSPETAREDSEAPDDDTDDEDDSDRSSQLSDGGELQVSRHFELMERSLNDSRTIWKTRCTAATFNLPDRSITPPLHLRRLIRVFL